MNDSKPVGDLKLQDISVGELEGVSLAVSTGEVVCISGASGSGKTRQSETPAHRWRAQIENRLMLGQPWHVAVGEIRRDGVRSGLIPVVNAMAAAGIVSLPGMMTGQILSGTPPAVAVKYQILIMFTIAVGTG